MTLQTLVRDLVTAAIAQETKMAVSDIHPHTPFEDYGISSVMGVAIIRLLEETFGELSKSLFFEFSTLSELVGYLLEEHHATLSQKWQGREGSKPISSIDPPVLSPILSHPPRVKETYTTVVPPIFGAMEEKEDPTWADAEEGEAGMRETETGSRDRYYDEEVAIIGMAGRFPKADDIETFWKNLVEGIDCITTVPERLWKWEEFWEDKKGVAGKSYLKWGGFLSDHRTFDPLFFGMSKLEADGIDPQERVFLETVYHLFEDAGYNRHKRRPYRVGLYVGVMWGQYQLYGGLDASAGSSYASIANRVSYFFDLKGPSIPLDTMCSGSMTTVHLACESLRRGETEMAIAGGVNLTTHPNKYLVLSKTGFASSHGRCKSFSADGDGYVPSEGVGAVLLKPLKKAERDGDRIHAVIRATAINHGGTVSGFTVPSVQAQEELITMALERANLDPQTITYVEAHAPGTVLGDPIEVRALTKAFGRHTDQTQFCAIGSVKSNIGHLESAASFASLAKVVKQLQEKTLVPSLHLEVENPNISFEKTPFYLQKTLTPWKMVLQEREGRLEALPRRAAINAFGAGGANAHMIVEEYLPRSRGERYPSGVDATVEGTHVFVLSARDETALMTLVNRYLFYIDDLLATRARIEDTDAADRVGEALGVVTGISASLLHHGDPLSDLLGAENALASMVRVLAERCHILVFKEEIARCVTVGDLIRMVLAKSARHYVFEGDAEERHLTNMAYTMQTGREALPRRLAIIAGSLSELKAALLTVLSNAPRDGIFQGIVKKNTLPPPMGPSDQRFITQLIDKRALGRVAELWCQGIDINWEKFYKSRPHLVPLPQYPFAKTICWAPQAPVSPLMAGEEAGAPALSLREDPEPVALDVFPSDPSDHGGGMCRLFKPVFSPLATVREGSLGHTLQRRGRCLVFFPHGCDVDVEHLLSACRFEKVYTMSYGLDCATELVSATDWRLSMADPGDLDYLLGQISPIEQVLFFGGSFHGLDDRIDPVEEVVFFHHVTRELMKLWGGAQGKNGALHVYTRLCEGADCSDRLSALAGGLSGYVRSLAREYPRLPVRLIDVDWRQGTRDYALAQTLQHLETTDVLENFMRGEVFLKRTLAAFHPETIDTSFAHGASVFQSQGVYLLIGGGGTVGFQLSCYLATHHRARIIWVHRSPLDQARKTAMDTIHRLGGTCAYYALDVQDKQAVGALVDDLVQAFGRVDGVFHLAMEREISRISALDPVSLKQRLGAKIAGTQALAHAFRGREPGFMVLFSSAEAYVGSVGWSAYTSGCSYQTQMAQYLSAQGFPTYAINWGFWEGVDDKTSAMLERKGVGLLSLADGVAVLTYVLSHLCPQLVALRAEDRVVDHMGFEREGAPPVQPVTITPINAEPVTIVPTEHGGHGAEVPSQGVLQAALIRLFSKVLRIEEEEMAVDEDMLNYGVDSLIVLNIQAELEAQAGALSVTVLLENQTISEVASALLSHYPEQAAALVRGSRAEGSTIPLEDHAPAPRSDLERASTQAMRAPSALEVIHTQEHVPGFENLRVLRRMSLEEGAVFLRAYGDLYRDKALMTAPLEQPFGEDDIGDRLVHGLVDSGQGAMEVIVVGEGPPVILMPAVAVTAPTWLDLLTSRLVKKYQFISLHPPGYGLSDPVKQCNTQGIVSSVMGALDGLGVLRFHVVGSCLGCAASVFLAKEHPDRVSSLTLVGAFHDTSDLVVGDPDRMSGAQFEELAKTAVASLRRDFEAVVEALPPMDALWAERIGDRRDLLLGAQCVNVLVALRYLNEMMHLSLLPWLPKVTVPTHCIYGDVDHIISPRHSYEISQAITGAQLTCICGSGHFPYLTHGEMFITVLDRFISSR